MVTELYIENNRLDINADISALLNFALDDVKDFSSRSTTWSKTIVLPGTQNNNRLFGHIFQPGQSNAYDPNQSNISYNFNAAKSADCIIFQDQIQTFKGILRLLQINVYKGLIEYEVSVFGKLAGLNVALSGGLLEDLDFSAYNHTYNDNNIVSSWDNPGGSGYYYPLIDYGTYSIDKHNWKIETFRPALYVREFIDKMITVAGYRWECELFDTPRFKTLVVPFNRKSLTVLSSNLFRGYNTGSKSGTFPVGSFVFALDNHTGTGFTANGTNDVFTYNGTTTTNLNIHFKFEGTFGGVSFFPTITLNVFKNGTSGTNIYSTFTIFSPFTIESTVTISFAPGDTIEFRFSGESGAAYNITSSSFDVTTTTAIPINVTIGDTIVLNDQIPKNIRQIDFLVGIVKLFNLYVYEDKFDTSLIHISPYIDFYSTDQSASVDWTLKMDRDQTIQIKPMSELTAKVYNFKFKEDSDYYNDLYRKRYSQGYGDRSYDSEFEFTEQKKEFEVIFSSTPLVGYGGEDKVYSTIFKQSNNNEETVDSNIRILQTKKITGVTPWNILSGAAVLNTLTRYGYAGHFDDPDAPATDINFGATRELFFVLVAGNLSNNQFNVYWSGYMREITDKDSKLLSANFYLNPADIANLDFSKYVYLDGVLFRLNSIKNYNASKAATCQVELLKVNEFNFTEATAPEGPPEGNYLLWSNENILYYDGPADDQEILWRGDIVNPSINYDFTKNLVGGFPTGRLVVYKNSVPFTTFTSTTAGTLVVSEGDVIEFRVIAGVAIPKGLTVESDIDGTLYDQPTGTSNKLFSWVAAIDNIYTVTATIN